MAGARILILVSDHNEAKELDQRLDRIEKAIEQLADQVVRKPNKKHPLLVAFCCLTTLISLSIISLWFLSYLGEPDGEFAFSRMGITFGVVGVTGAFTTVFLIFKHSLMGLAKFAAALTVIMAIATPLMVPQYVDAPDDAAVRATYYTLQTINSQIELFRFRNHGESPDLLEKQWVPMLGEFLKSEPLNAMTGSARIVTRDSATAGDGWVFEPEQGTVIPIVPNKYHEFFENDAFAVLVSD